MGLGLQVAQSTSAIDGVRHGVLNLIATGKHGRGSSAVTITIKKALRTVETLKEPTACAAPVNNMNETALPTVPFREASGALIFELN